MSVPAGSSAEILIQDYLARVTAAARVLPKGARVTFVGRTRALIEREIGASGMADPRRVLEVLSGLGEPEELVAQERARIEHRAFRPIKSRWKPAAETQPPQPPAPESRRQPPSVPGKTDGTGPRAWPAGRDAVVEPDHAHDETLARSAARLGRAHVRESVAVLLLGIGGLILPFPFWLLGALVAVFSRLWDVRDKAVAWGGPLVVALLGSVITALIRGGTANVVMIYTHALSVDFGLLVRAGCLLCAAYLAWRVYQGPRVKVPPWQRR